MTARDVDFIKQGDGPAVILIHSSVAGARQWLSLMNALADRFHLISINLFGYGGTAAWPNDRAQTLDDQARLLYGLLPDDGSEFSLVGHSFGGSVSMKAAVLFRDRLRRLVLIDPNPFYLLQQAGRSGAIDEAMSLRNCIKENGAKDDWRAAAAVFADYWIGAGSWASMPDDRQAKFAEALKPNFHEWDAVMNETVPLSEWAATLPRDTTVISAADTVRSIREIVDLMRRTCPHWDFEELAEGGHMALLTRPELVNPTIARALS